MTTTFDERHAIGEAFERQVATMLRARGWSVERIGQGTWSRETRERLHRGTSHVRWMPDLLAVSRDGVPVMVDCKSPLEHRSALETFAVEAKAVQSHLALSAWIEVLYVWSEGLLVMSARGADRGRYVTPAPRGRGSGTPLVLVTADLCVDFNDAFGRPGA